MKALFVFGLIMLFIGSTEVVSGDGLTGPVFLLFIGGGLALVASHLKHVEAEKEQATTPEERDLEEREKQVLLKEKELDIAEREQRIRNREQEL